MWLRDLPTHIELLKVRNAVIFQGGFVTRCVRSVE